MVIKNTIVFCFSTLLGLKVRTQILALPFFPFQLAIDWLGVSVAFSYIDLLQSIFISCVLICNSFLTSFVVSLSRISFRYLILLVVMKGLSANCDAKQISC